MSILTRAARAAIVGAVALTMTVGVAALPAHASTIPMTSHINRHAVPNGTPTPDQYVIDISGVVSISQSAAQDAINHGYTIALRYWGDDPYTDDLIWGPIRPRTVFAAADGLHFQHYVTLPTYLLDEDDNGIIQGSHDDGQDEIYVGSRLLDPRGNTAAKVESNRITGYF